MDEHFFALIPDAHVYTYINECKNTAKELCGDQLYLADPPHSTLYVGSFNICTELLEKIGNIRLKKHAVNIKGWHTFFDDPVTHKHTLTLQIADEDIPDLQKIQQTIADIARDYRQVSHIPRYNNRTAWSAEMLASFEKYGFPFIGKIWQPHLTVASFEPEAYDQAAEAITATPHPPSVLFDTLKVNRILKKGFEEIHSFTGNQHA